jgi:poly(hydroxyalkanoate) depolymerase family esterase
VKVKTRVARALLGLAVLSATAGTGAVLTAAPAGAASLQQVTNFGTNPSNLRLYQYVPDRLQARPPIVVALHYCQGTAAAMYGSGVPEWVTAANQYGYVMLFPEATRSGSCWDVSSPQALRRGGGSDPVGIMSMVSWAQQRYNADPSRIYVIGMSSGAMMTQVLSGLYPDVFKAAVSFSGVPFGCFATGSTTNLWNSQCSGGQLVHTPAEWAAIVRNAYPGYSGPYPRIQVWHGVNDTTLRYQNFIEAIEQWTAVQGVSQTPSFTDRPTGNYTRTRYGGSGTYPPVEGISVANAGHSLGSGMAPYAIRFLGLDQSGGTTTTTTTTTRPTTSSTTTSSTTTSSSTTSASSSTTTSGSGTTTTTGGSGSGGCSAAFSAPNPWPGGFVGNVTVTANQALSGWRVTLTLPTGVSVTGSWNATVSGSTGTVTATNAAYNGTLAAGGSTTFGFQGSGSPSGVTVSCSAG